VVSAGAVGAVALVQIYRYRLVLNFAQRQQTKWVVLGIVAAVGYCMFLVLNLLQGGILANLLGYSAALLLLFLLPISIVVAVLRYRLYDIDIIINRTLVYSTLTAMLVALYFAAIVVLQRSFVILTGQRSTLAVVASTLLIAALFNPLRRRIQFFIDRSFYRSKYDARKTLEAFSTKLRNETNLEAVSGDLVAVVKETMQPAHASLWLRSETVGQRDRED
jgi:hypothetical protein